MLERIEVRVGVALVLACTLAACGGEVMSGDGGGGGGGEGGAGGGKGGSTHAGGGGGEGGEGGWTGSGGSGTGGGDIECSDAIQGSLQIGGPQVGFETEPGEPGSAVVVAVHEDGMELSLGADGNPVLFGWTGPSLAESFTPGDFVTIGVDQGWSYVIGETRTAAAMWTMEFVGPESLPEVPNGGPAISYAPQCTFVEAMGSCGQPPSIVTVLALSASLGSDTALVVLGGIENLNGWMVHNAMSVQYPGYGSDDCVLEAFFGSTVTALGPSPPAGG